MPVQCSQMSEAFFPPHPGCPLCYPGSLLHHNPASLSSPDATSATLHFECYNHKFPQKPFCWSDKQHLSWLSCCATEICSPYSQSIKPQRLPAVFSGRPAPPPPPSTECAKGRAKGLCMSDFCFPLFLFPVPFLDFDLEMSDSFYLMWKKNTEINYLIFLML